MRPLSVCVFAIDAVFTNDFGCSKGPLKIKTAEKYLKNNFYCGTGRERQETKWFLLREREREKLLIWEFWVQVVKVETALFGQNIAFARSVVNHRKIKIDRINWYGVETRDLRRRLRVMRGFGVARAVKCDVRQMVRAWHRCRHAPEELAKWVIVSTELVPAIADVPRSVPNLPTSQIKVHLSHVFRSVLMHEREKGQKGPFELLIELAAPPQPEFSR